MALNIPGEKNPFFGTGVFEILGVPPTATASELRDRHDELVADVKDRHEGDNTMLVRELKRINDAYETVRTAKGRLSAQFFLLDPDVGRSEARRAAKQAESAKFPFDRILRQGDEVFRRKPYTGHLVAKYLGSPFVAKISIGAWDRFRAEGAAPDPQSLIEFDR